MAKKRFKPVRDPLYLSHLAREFTAFEPPPETGSSTMSPVYAIPTPRGGSDLRVPRRDLYLN